MIKKGKMKIERKKKEEEEETMIYVNNKPGTCMSLEYGVLMTKQTAYMDSSCGMGSWGEQSVDHLEISVSYKPFSVNILRYQSLR